ncbi:MAG TPA: hypothetical protein VLO09_00285 [Ornithinimicrobium sp.]|nr:hypothetical protein [Ornithinimicrobium sp.]
MSTRTPPRSLFRALVDDAAVFPPGDAPVPVAWAEHLRLRRGGYADLLGPLLVGTAHAQELARVAAGPGGDHAPVDVAVVARAGVPVQELVTAATRLRGLDAVRVVSVEVTLDEDGSSRHALPLVLPVPVEVDRDPATLPGALDELRSAAPTAAAPVLAKLRTQATAEHPVPTAVELAGFLSAAQARDLPVKLTGGLHHALARTSAEGHGRPTLQRHGLLNVLAALVHLHGGADEQTLADVLTDEDPARLGGLLTSLDEPSVARLRHRFRSFGCCGVTDPLDELVGLGLLAAVPVPR